MKMIEDIRRENLAALRKEFGRGGGFADLIGKSEAQITQWIKGSKNSGTGKPRGMRPETARLIESKCGKPPGWLDTIHIDEDNPQSFVNTSPDEPPPTAPQTTKVKKIEIGLRPKVKALLDLAEQLNDDGVQGLIAIAGTYLDKYPRTHGKRRKSSV